LRLFLIGVFGAIGTLARYGLQGLVQIKIGSTFPYGTLLINLTGCFFLGLIGQILLNRMIVPAEWRMAIAVGFFGGYTTFSSFGWESGCGRRGMWRPAWRSGCCFRWRGSGWRTGFRKNIRGHLKVAATQVIYVAPEI
jgi:CrcB protein